jgi:hypothetical protein
MIKQKLHFEQVPLEIVKKTVEKQNGEQVKAERVQRTWKKKLETDIVWADTVKERGGTS